jgi:pullulanase
MSIEQRVRAHNMALSIPLMSQGIPFMQLGADLLRSKSMDRDSYNAGDWFNAVDLTKENNNWNIGLPNAEKNQEKWSEIMPISANADAQAMPQDIAYAGDVFQEFLAIRSASPLFRLTTEQDVIDRVGFHNVGKNQQHGLIVMSIDDGQGFADLDNQIDALVVVINATEQALSHTVPTAAGFELHPILKNGVDSTMAGVSFSENETDGTFTVPAYTMAVFVKPQGESQGAGLSADATVGAPDIVPYGSTEVYLRGDLNEWGLSDQFEYVGSSEYQIMKALTAGESFGFKVASESWELVNFGANSEQEAVVQLGVEKQLSFNGANISFTADTADNYLFSFNASDKENPTLTVTKIGPFGNVSLYLRGSLNEADSLWGTDDQFTYTGDGLYTFSKQLSAQSDAYEFKVATSDWSTVNLGAGGDSSEVILGSETPLAASNNNLSLLIETEGEYRFVVNANDLEAPFIIVNLQ